MNCRIRLIFVLLLGAVIVTAAWFFLGHLAVPEVRNVVLISIDTCRADYLSCYGHLRKITPTIDAIAGKSVLFKKVVAPVPMTLPSHSSMFTGTIPPYHGVHDNLGAKLDASNVTLAEILRDEGYATGAIVSTFILDSKLGIGQGFDTYADYNTKTTGLTGKRLAGGRRGDDVSRLACTWLDAHKSDRSFLFLHFFDPHTPYEPPEPFAATYSDNLYAGEIAYVDRCIGRVVDKLKELGLFDETLIIITSDHGEMLGEHGEAEHSYFVYESAIKVPLIFKLPRRSRHIEVDDTVGLVDILPTVCGLLGIDPPAQVQGKDLSPYCRKNAGPRQQRNLYTESLTPTKVGCSSLLGIIRGNWKYIQTTRPELYDIAKDPGETNNLVAKESKRARFLAEHLKLILTEQVRNSSGGNSEIALDDESKKRLESLGYIGGIIDNSLEFNDSKNDPKDLIHIHEKSKKATIHALKKQYRQAKELCREMLDEYPDLLYVHDLSGRIAFETDDMASAITHYSKVLHLNPRVLGALKKMALAYHKQGEFAIAADRWKEAIQLKSDDIESYNNLAMEFVRLNRPDEAIEYWSKSLQLKPDQPILHNELGLIHYQQDSIADAVRHWHEARSLRPNWARVLNDLAWVYTTRKDTQFYNPSKAVDLAERACELTQHKAPGFLDTLSVAYAAVGRYTEAIEIGKEAIKLFESSEEKKLAEDIRKRIETYNEQ
jgi:arylsulfatase A-like enzyme/Flp pilus assembly protein TadD